MVEVPLIISGKKGNETQRLILNAINTYLLRNRGNVSDFGLIRDIVERNTESLDEEINSQIPIPLYLGLMGTMLGIILGLFFIPSIDNMTGSKYRIGDAVTYINTEEKGIISHIYPDNTFDLSFKDGKEEFLRERVQENDIRKPVGVDILLGGVKIAMISSFIGLLLTVLLSGWFYKRAKILSVYRKNSFYTFIQTELLPVMVNDSASVIRTLEHSLNNFNSEFGKNASVFNNSFASLNGVVSEISKASLQFKNLMTEIQKLNFLKLSKVNAELLEKIRINSAGFDKFNVYLHQVESFINSAQQLNNALNDQLLRTRSIEDVAQMINHNFEQNQKILTLVESGIMEIESRKQILSDAVISVDDQIQKSLKALENHTIESINTIKNISIQEEVLLDKIRSEGSVNFDKLKKLDKVEENLAKMIIAASDQNSKLANLNDGVNRLIEAVKKQDKSSEFKFPKPLVKFAYVFLGMGVILGGGLIIHKLSVWIPLLFRSIINLF